MAIARQGTNTENTGTTSPLQFNHTLVAGSQRLVVVYVGDEVSGNLTISATYGGQAMTLAAAADSTPTLFSFQTRIFYILEADLPSDGVNQVSITFTGTLTSFECQGHCAQYSGVAQGVPDDTDATEEPTPADDTIENTGLTGASGDLLVSAVGCGNVGTYTHNQSQAELMDFADASSTFACTDLIATGSITTLESIYATGANRMSRVAAQWGPSVAASEQEGFRFRNDNGSETTATWRQSQDVDDTVGKTQTIRLRILVNATGDLPSAAYRLEYKETADAAAEWRPVPLT